jgi:hypothetical protein
MYIGTSSSFQLHCFHLWPCGWQGGRLGDRHVWGTPNNYRSPRAAPLLPPAKNETFQEVGGNSGRGSSHLRSCTLTKKMVERKRLPQVSEGVESCRLGASLDSEVEVACMVWLLQSCFAQASIPNPLLGANHQLTKPPNHTMNWGTLVHFTVTDD